MKCPHCEKGVVLTWRRYWKASLGRHICPHCEKLFRMKHSFKYYGTLGVLWVVLGFFPARVALVLGATELQGLAVLLLFGLVFILPIDRKVDAT